MAKITGPVNTSAMPAQGRSMLELFGKSTTTSIRFNDGRDHATTEQRAVLQARIDRANAAWFALSPWKKARWSMCAMAHASTGRRLYCSIYVKYNVATGKQPISPCSRRVTNQLSSPHDYTP